MAIQLQQFLSVAKNNTVVANQNNQGEVTLKVVVLKAKRFLLLQSTLKLNPILTFKPWGSFSTHYRKSTEVISPHI